MQNNNTLYLIWKSPLSSKDYVVGKLTKADEYTFEYTKDCEKAKEDGWGMIPAFPESKEYHSKALFSAFSSRLPDKKRRNINQILNKYGLDEYDGYELLRKSGGRLPIDTYSFVEPNGLKYAE